MKNQIYNPTYFFQRQLYQIMVNLRVMRLMKVKPPMQLQVRHLIR